MKKEEKIKFLNNQKIFKGHNINWNDDILNKIKVLKKDKGDIIINEGDSSSDIFFIFNGKVDIIVKDKTIAFRESDEYIGEIVALFNGMKRTATCKVSEKSIIAKMSSKFFTDLLDANPTVYKEISFILAKRLEQRNSFIKKNLRKIPNLFVASSTEGLKIINKIVKKFNRKFVNIIRWDLDVFEASETNIKNLEDKINNSDFGLVVFTPDDKYVVRKKNYTAPRDNLIFELGLLFGVLKRDRTFYISTDDKIKLPTDLNGVIYLTLKNCHKRLEKIIKEKGVIKNV